MFFKKQFSTIKNNFQQLSTPQYRLAAWREMRSYFPDFYEQKTCFND